LEKTISLQTFDSRPRILSIKGPHTFFQSHQPASNQGNSPIFLSIQPKRFRVSNFEGHAEKERQVGSQELHSSASQRETRNVSLVVDANPTYFP
jgi:dihydropteroate synthase